MKHMKVLGAFISSLTLLSLNIVGLSQAQAQTQGFQFQNVLVSVLGNGCPSGNAQVSLAGNTLFVTFPRFQAIAASPKVVSQSCSLRIGLNVPKGYKVQPINLRYSGFTNVPQSGSAALRVRGVFQGKNILNSSNNLDADFSSGFSNGWLKDVSVTGDTINACANPVNSVFGINTTLIARATNVAGGQRTQIGFNGTYRIRFNLIPC
ncbi:MAG: DUF4360 domain-containing protein [Nostoc sp.]